jgi:hypothetical protein
MSSHDANEGWTSVEKPKKAKLSKQQPVNELHMRSVKSTRPDAPKFAPARQRRPESTMKEAQQVMEHDVTIKVTKSVMPKEIAVNAKPKNSAPPQPKKAKKRQTESMGLMDIIEAQLRAGSASREKSTQKKNATATPAASAKKSYQSSEVVKVVRSKDPTNKEFRVVTKKKKKKLSTVKKRVLMVCYPRIRNMQPIF